MHDENTLSKLKKRFLKRIEIGQYDECWFWLGGSTPEGYGLFNGGEPTKSGAYHKKITAHRFAYILEYGGIPKGYVVDHLCRTPPCVNPRHLEAVTQKENVRRGTGIGRPGKKSSESEKISIREEYTGKHGDLLMLSNKYTLSKSHIRKILGLNANISTRKGVIGRPPESKNPDWHRHDKGRTGTWRWHPKTQKHHKRL